jgi:EAL domain-containing protein (putative c-di-GMP-specific phosphodiesterase class I)
MSTLAEGIETEDEWRFLTRRGCPFGQGYLFAKPVPAEDIADLYRRRALRLLRADLAG